MGVASWPIEEHVQEAPHCAPIPEGMPRNTLFVPQIVCSEVLQWGYSFKLACYPGVRRMLHLLRQGFWWPSMAPDVHDFLTECPMCAWGKPSHQAPSGLLHPLTIPQHPWSHIAVDFITGPSDGDMVILTVVDHFSKLSFF